MLGAIVVHQLDILGYPLPRFSEDCGVFTDTNSLCDDWDIFVKPDPEYQFLLAHDSKGHDDNFDQEHQGNLEQEIEQWLIPNSYKPDPGDRIYMTDRWIIDCGHNDWHNEFHPIESFVNSHALVLSRGTTVEASVIVTGAWQGGALELDIWPSASATLQMEEAPITFPSQKDLVYKSTCSLMAILIIFI